MALKPGGLLDSRSFSGADIPSSWKAIISIVNIILGFLNLSISLKHLNSTLSRSTSFVHSMDEGQPREDNTAARPAGSSAERIERRREQNRIAQRNHRE
jgi:hypothetical protein